MTESQKKLLIAIGIVLVIYIIYYLYQSTLTQTAQIPVIASATATTTAPAVVITAPTTTTPATATITAPPATTAPTTSTVTVSVPSQICGVDASQNIYCTTPNGSASPTWGKFNYGGLSNIAMTSKGDMYGVNSSGQIFYDANLSTTNTAFTQLGGALVQVSAGDNMVCGVNAAGTPYCATIPLAAGNTNWVTLPNASLINISVSSTGELYGLNSVKQLYYSPSNTSGKWTQVNMPSVPFTQVSTDAGSVCGLDVNGNVFCSSPTGIISPTWKQIPGQSLQKIQLHNGALLGVTTAGGLVYTSSIVNPSWTTIGTSGAAALTDADFF